ncbi:MAG: ribosome silencing factor [Janthinobacterium lividum]
MALTPAAGRKAVATPHAVTANDPDVLALHTMILASLEDDQAVEVVSIPLAGKTSIADHMVIASGRSTRQVASMAQKIAERAKTELGRAVRIEGLPAADWVLIDAQDVIVHLFRPDVRSFYNLEKMWAFDGPSGSTSDRRAPPKVAPVADIVPEDDMSVDAEPMDVTDLEVEDDDLEPNLEAGQNDVPFRDGDDGDLDDGDDDDDDDDETLPAKG